MKATYRLISHRIAGRIAYGFGGRVIMVLGMLVVAFASYAGDMDKTYRKMIEKYDVADEAKMVEAYAPGEFWYTALKNNELLRKFKKEMKKSKGAEKEATAKIMELPRLYPLYDESIVENMQGFCDSLLMDMGIADAGVNCSLHIIDSNTPNYFSALTEDGFAICLTSGLVNKKGINHDILKGYVANEFAHGALMHSQRGLYADAKQRRKDNLINGIVGGAVLAAVCLVPDAYSSDCCDHCYVDGTSSESNAEKNKDYKKEINSSSIEFAQKYTHAQVYEADLVAYRFLENVGSGEEFINGLKILGSNYDAFYEENRCDRPSISERIAFLNYVQSNPQLGNKVNNKIRQAAIQAVADRKRRR